jgi:hypothetical protein
VSRRGTEDTSFVRFTASVAAHAGVVEGERAVAVDESQRAGVAGGQGSAVTIGDGVGLDVQEHALAREHGAVVAQGE